MNQSLEQTLRHLQVPQQRLLQVMKFLQLTREELDQELRTELERNPALTMRTGEPGTPSASPSAENEDGAREELDSANLYDPSRNLLGGQGFRTGRGGGDISAKMEAMANTPDLRTTFQDQLFQRYQHEESNERLRRIATYMIYSMDDNGYLRQPLHEIADTMNEAVERGLRQAITSLIFLLHADPEAPTDWATLESRFHSELEDLGLPREDVAAGDKILEKLHAQGVDFRAIADRALTAGPPVQGAPALDVRREILLKHLRDVGRNRLGKVVDALLDQVLEWDSRLRAAIVAKLQAASLAEVTRRKAEAARQDGMPRLVDEAERPRLSAKRAFVDAIHDPKVQDAFSGIYWIMERLVAAKSAAEKAEETEDGADKEGEEATSSAQSLLDETSRVMTHYYPIDKIYIAEDGTMLPPRQWGLRDAAERKRIDIDSILLEEVYRAVESLRAGVLAELDQGGRLTAAMAEVLAPLRATVGELETVLSSLKRLGPAGVGARTTIECLLLQLDPADPDIELKRRLIEFHMSDIEKNRLPQIAVALGVDIDKVKELISELKQLTPKPANALASSRVPPVNPDIVVEWVDDRYEVRLLRSFRDRLVVNPIYRKLLEDKTIKGKERQFMREKVQSARTFIEFVMQREIITEKIARHIVDCQKEFFEKGLQGLKALTMTEVARQIGVDPATVSRAVRGRYIQTPRGIFPLRYFFSEGLPSNQSSGEVASEGLRAMIREIIDKEDKRNPLDDGAIARLLLKDHGVKVARRTVREYRTKMHIGKASQRKQY